MEAKEYRTVDKSAWGDGPWQDEPDKMQFTDEATGLPCLIVRNLFGSLCGYVGVAEGHPAFGRGYDDVDVDVHGGLTFADFCTDGGDESAGICHLPAPGEPDRIWWLGFDCAHAWDISPAHESRFGDGLGVDGTQYRDLGYVKSEIARLAAQLAAKATA